MLNIEQKIAFLLPLNQKIDENKLIEGVLKH